MKAARIMAIMFNKAKKLDSSKELTEVINIYFITISNIKIILILILFEI